MKKTKKFFSILLSIAMLISVMSGFGITIYAVDGTYVSGDYEYIYDDENKITITKYSGNDSKIVIPSTIDNVEVKGIGPYTFKNCQSLESITLSENIESFYFNAFEGCTNLTQLTVDKNNKTFDSRNNCNAIINTERNELSLGIKTTVIPNDIESIGVNAFRYTDSPENVIIPNSVKYIQMYAFYGCNNLKKLRISGSVEFIGVNAFRDCYNLQMVEIAEGATDIGAFENCKNLTNIVIPKSVITFAADAFSGCDNLKSITILNKDLKYSNGDDNYWGMYDGLPKITVIYGYKNSTAQRYAEEYNRTFIAIDEPVIAEGTDTVYILGSENGAAIHCVYPLDTFVSVSVDGKTVDKENYTLADGSTILTFKPSFLNTLSVGKHTVEMKYTIGTVTTGLIIEDKDVNRTESKNDEKAAVQIKNESTKSPDTGRNSSLAAVISAAALSAGVILVSVKKKKS